MYNTTQHTQESHWELPIAESTFYKLKPKDVEPEEKYVNAFRVCVCACVCVCVCLPLRCVAI